MTTRQSTLLGRVVYKRKKHEFTLKDVQRIATRMKIPSTYEELIAANAVLLQIYLQILMATLFSIPSLSRYRLVLGVVRNAIGSIWKLFFDAIPDPPKEARGGIRIEGGLSLL